MSCPEKKNKQGASVQGGQALIVILLVSAIGLTIGLTLASRSTEETSITTKLEESSRAFSAAEAGLEESIQHIGEGENVYTGSLSSAADFNVQVEIAGGQAGAFQFPGEVENNQTVTVWLTGHDTSGEIDWSVQYGKDTIDVCWGESGGTDSALEITYYSKDGSDYYIARQVFQPRGSNTVQSAQEVDPVPVSSKVCDGDYGYNETVDFSAGSTNMIGQIGTTKAFMRIRPIFNVGVTNGRTRLAVDSGTTELPTQGELHTSIGTTTSGYQTKIVQFISHTGPPELFDAVIFSEQMLSK